MTVKDLSRFQYLEGEIDTLEEHLAELDFLLEQLTQDAIRDAAYKGELDHCIADIIYTKELIREKICEREKERRWISEFIFSINDSLLRTIFIYRYIDGLKWFEIADKIGGGNTDESVKLLHWRFLKKYNAGLMAHMHPGGQWERECCERL